MGHSLSAKVESVCQNKANDIALFQHGEIPITFENLFFSVLRFSEILQDSGVGAGNVVAVPLQDPIAVLTFKLALLRMGVVVAAVGHKASLNDGRSLVDRVIVSGDQAIGHSKEIVFTPSWIRSPTRYVPIVNGGRIVHATSGTTGTPKLRADDEQTFLARINNGLRARGPCDGPVFIGQNIASLIGIKSSVTAVLSGQPQTHALESEQKTLMMLRDRGIVHAFIPPIHLRSLVEEAEKEKSQTPELKRINVGGGAISSGFAAKCEEIFGCEVHNDYGSTETDTIASLRVSKTEDAGGVVGRVYPIFETRFTGSKGAEETSATGGELWLKVPANLRPRSFPDNTPLCDRDGWIATGDFGHITKEGFLVIAGRKSDFINVGGNKISPSTFEKLASRFPNILEVAAFKIGTDSGIDDVGFAVVVNADFDQANFQFFLRRELPSIYRTKTLILEKLPMTETGKPDRIRLNEMVQ